MRAAADADDRAVGEHDFQAEDVIAGDAVFQAARAAGVGGDVAADVVIRAAGGIGRIKEAVLSTASCNCFRDDARLDDGDEIVGVDFLDAVHAFERKHDAAAHRHTAADVTKARPAGGDGNAMPMAKRSTWRPI